MAKSSISIVSCAYSVEILNRVVVDVVSSSRWRVNFNQIVLWPGVYEGRMIYISTPDPLTHTVSSSITSSILLHCSRIYRVSHWSTPQLTQITRRYHSIICYETALSLSLSLWFYTRWVVTTVVLAPGALVAAVHKVQQQNTDA